MIPIQHIAYCFFTGLGRRAILSQQSAQHEGHEDPHDHDDHDHDHSSSTDIPSSSSSAPTTGPSDGGLAGSALGSTIGGAIDAALGTDQWNSNRPGFVSDQRDIQKQNAEGASNEQDLGVLATFHVVCATAATCTPMTSLQSSMDEELKLACAPSTPLCSYSSFVSASRLHGRYALANCCWRQFVSRKYLTFVCVFSM